MSEIQGALREFIETQGNWDSGAELSPTTPLLEQGVIDSLGIHRLVAMIEARFGVTVMDDDLEPANFESLAALTAFVEQRVR